MHQIIFIDGFSGIGKTTLAKSLHEHYKGVYIEQYMIPNFVTKDGKTPINGREEDETLYRLMVANIKEFASLGYKNIIALDFNEVRFRDIPIDFKGYDYLILHLVCNKDQNLKQMKNRGEGLIDASALEKDYARVEKYPRPLLPNEIRLDVTNKTADEVFAEAVKLIDKTKSELSYEYTMPDKRCFGTWVKANQEELYEQSKN